MRSNSHMVATSLFISAFATLHGCGNLHQPSSSTSDNTPLKTAVSAQQRHEDRVVFEKMAPPGWSLRRFDDGIASYLISISQKPYAPKIGVVSGTITSDGRNESMVKLRRAIAKGADDTDQEREQALSLYPDFEGYEKDVAVDSIGYDVKRGKDIHAVAYYNLDKGISCYGHAPGQFRCYWGTPHKRMSLHFNAEDFSIVLPYVLNMPGVH